MNSSYLYGLKWVVIFLPFLIIPYFFVQKICIDYPHLKGVFWFYFWAISAFTMFFYTWDKRSARRGEWRTPEARLHLLALLGGWFIAYWIQKIIRHKTKKFSFQLKFWFIAFVQQLLMFDYIHNWYYARQFFSVTYSFVIG